MERKSMLNTKLLNVSHNPVPWTGSKLARTGTHQDIFSNYWFWKEKSY